MTVLTVPLLAGCLTEEPLPLEVQPLEIVVESRTSDEPCLLNVSMVRAGDHAVSLISERGVATVRIVDARGRDVFKDDTSDQKIVEDEDGNVTVIEGGEGDEPTIRLDAGRYDVRCLLKGGRMHTTPLEVKPARPGAAG